MKKTIVIVSLLLLAAGFAFADGWIGVDTGADIKWIKNADSPVDITTTEIDYYLGASGAHYFGDSAGLGYSVSMLYPLMEKVGESDFHDIKNPDIIVKTSLSFQFKHDFSRSVSLEAGAGAYYAYSSQEVNSNHQIGIEGNVGLSFGVLDHLTLKLGAKVLVPVCTIKSTTVLGVTEEFSVSEYGVGVIPYLGVAYSY